MYIEQCVMKHTFLSLTDVLLTHLLWFRSRLSFSFRFKTVKHYSLLSKKDKELKRKIWSTRWTRDFNEAQCLQSELISICAFTSSQSADCLYLSKGGPSPRPLYPSPLLLFPPIGRFPLECAARRHQPSRTTSLRAIRIKRRGAAGHSLLDTR